MNDTISDEQVRLVLPPSDEPPPTPVPVIAAVAAGTAPLPFLAVYAVLFIVHGGLHPVVPPDITETPHGELGAGFVALGLFLVALVSLLMFMGGRRRWPFVIVQLAVCAVSIDFLVDPTIGGQSVSALLAVTSAIALVCAIAPGAWTHVGRKAPQALVRGSEALRTRVATAIAAREDTP